MHAVISLTRSSTGIIARRRCGCYIVMEDAGPIDDCILYEKADQASCGAQTTRPSYIPICSRPNQNGTTLFVIHHDPPSSLYLPYAHPHLPQSSHHSLNRQRIKQDLYRLHAPQHHGAFSLFSRCFGRHRRVRRLIR